MTRSQPRGCSLLVKLFLNVFATLFFYLPVSGAFAEEPFGPTRQELKLLPSYCTDKLVTKNKARLQQLFGNRDWQHIHHYCFALNFINRARNALVNDSRQRYYLQNAASNLNYMITHTGPDFILLPEIYIKYGNVLEMQGKTLEAIDSYHKAIKVKPDYTSGYIALSEYYKGIGDIKQARKFLELGLENNPDSKSLKRRLSRLK